MARQSKRKKGSGEDRGEVRPEAALPPGNRPFAEIARELQSSLAAAPDEPAPAPARTPPEESAGPTDEELFRQAIGDVRPLAAKTRQRVPPARPLPSTVPHYDEDADSLAKLAAMMDGAEPLGHEFSEEHTAWIADDVDPGLLPRLVSGEFAYQDHVDLHGMTREQARAAVFRFLAGARIANHRCVLIVHGRGHHSEDSVPVIKLALQRWLRRGAIKQWVFAYASARPVDGGAGAMYVMLRRT